MRLHRMDLKHFRVHKNTTIHLDDGLTAIVGQNESGKSSVLEALTWALYGGPAVRGSVKGLRWRNAPARQTAKVEVHLTLGDTEYMVLRTETNARVHARRAGTGDEWAQVADGTSHVTEYMTARVGMSLPEFSSSYLCNQSDVARLAAMGPEARRTFIRRIMGAEKLDAAVADARRTARDVKYRLEGVQSTLGDGDELAGVVTLAETELEHRQSVASDARVARDVEQHQLEEYDKELEHFQDLARQYAALRTEINGIGSSIAVRRDSRKDALDTLARAEAQVEEWQRLRQDLKGFRSIRLMLTQMDETAETVQRVEAARGNIKLAKARIDELDEEMRQVQAFIDVFDRPELEAAIAAVAETERRRDALAEERRTRCATLKGRIAQAKRERDTMSRATGTGVCPTCGQDLKSLDEVEAAVAKADAEIRAAIDELASAELASDDERAAIAAAREAADHAHQMDLARIRKKDAEARLARLNKQMAAMKERKRRLIETIADVEAGSVSKYDPAKHKEARALHRDMERKQARSDAIQTCGEEVGCANARIAQLDAQLDAMAKKQRAAEAALGEVRYDDEHHKATHSLRTETREKLLHCRRAVAEADKAVAVIERDLAAARQRLADHRERQGRVTALRGDLAFHEQVRDRLQEFRGSVLDTVKPDLAELVSGMLAHLTDGRHESVTLDDSFAVVVHEAGMESQVVSGGTEDLVALVMRIALSQLISERSGGAEILILDEPYGSLDSTRRANVTQLLESLRDVFPQVILISHVSETRHIGDQIVELEYDPDRQYTSVV
ncbi:MAG: SMC family ATPase [Gemmatimonadetes bacterium]|nr:SMC family ATPase [Gemmatimonadota bacterium]